MYPQSTKKGSRSNSLNYRPISLTFVSCKMMECIITKMLYSFLNTHLILDENQLGFQSHRSVVDQLLLTYNYVTKYYNRGDPDDPILFDFQKAFDKVHHQILVDKLTAIGITGTLFRWIESFLSNRTMKVCISGMV